MSTARAILVEDAIAKLKVVVEGEVELKGVPKLESYLKLGDRAYKDGEFDEAYINYSKALELDPDNAIAILRQGLSKVLKGRSFKDDFFFWVKCLSKCDKN